jgi:hypothetical protein
MYHSMPLRALKDTLINGVYGNLLHHGRPFIYEDEVRWGKGCYGSYVVDDKRAIVQKGKASMCLVNSNI